MKFLLWIALIAAAVWFWRKFKRAQATPQTRDEPAAAPMVRCAQCGVHLPRERALSQQQDWYCCQAHQDLGPSTRAR